MSEIVMIEGKHLYEHPDNPRKTLGDLTELTNSISKVGILQNLTVVPGHWRSKDQFVKDAMAEGMTKSDATSAYSREQAWEPIGYTVIIGHRRRAAGLAAGITEFPCIISDMDERQQFLTMLEENMQRADLTIQEQAQGFQMMFDWGASIKDIAEKSGFSEQTVKHRLEIAKLDPKKIQKVAEELQLTINDYVSLEKIKDIKRRERVLENARNRNDLKFAIEREMRGEIIDKAWAELEPLLTALNIKAGPKNKYLRWNSEYIKLREIDLEKKIPKTLTLKDVSEGDKLVYEKEYSTVYILKHDPDKRKEEAAVEEKKRLEKEKIKKQIDEKVAQMCRELKEMISSVYEGKLTSSKSEDITMNLLWQLWSRHLNEPLYWSNIYELSGNSSYALTDQEKREVRGNVIALPLSAQFLVVLRAGFYPNRVCPVDYKGDYMQERGEALEFIVKTFNRLYGFSWSEDEFGKIADGTHELYRKLKAMYE